MSRNCELEKVKRETAQSIPNSKKGVLQFNGMLHTLYNYGEDGIRHKPINRNISGLHCDTLIAGIFNIYNDTGTNESIVFR